MEDPAGQGLEALGRHPAYTGTATDGRDSGIGVWILKGSLPGAKSAHADAREINEFGIHLQGFDQVIRDRFDAMRIPQIVGFALQAGDDGGKFLSSGEQLRRPVFFDQFEVVAAFTGAVQEDHQRPFFICAVIIALRLAKEVLIVDFNDKITAE